ncbi:MAG: hypothetical protein JWN78_2479 [Bacteroidota bacterium]|nr:hypothetical protein [Bacteroidota bacterium]
MKNLKKEFTATLLLIAINVFVIGVVYLSDYLLKFISNVHHKFLIFFIWLVLCIGLYYLYDYFDNRITKIIFYTVCFPALILFVISKILLPLLGVQMYLFFYVIGCILIPASLLKLNNFFHWFTLTNATSTYILISSGCIIAIVLHEQLSKVILYLTSKIQNETYKDIIDYLISEKNIKFVIYLAYLIFLAVYNVNNLEGSSFYNSPELDKAVLQSFITFLAFERVLINFKESEFKPTQLLTRIKDSIFNDKVKL